MAHKDGWVRNRAQIVAKARELANSTPGGRYEYADGMVELIAELFAQNASDVRAEILDTSGYYDDDGMWHTWPPKEQG